MCIYTGTSHKIHSASPKAYHEHRRLQRTAPGTTAALCLAPPTPSSCSSLTQNSQPATCNSHTSLLPSCSMYIPLARRPKPTSQPAHSSLNLMPRPPPSFAHAHATQTSPASRHPLQGHILTALADCPPPVLLRLSNSLAPPQTQAASNPHPASAHTQATWLLICCSVTHVPWKPYGTRCGMRTAATGLGAILRASGTR